MGKFKKLRSVTPSETTIEDSVGEPEPTAPEVQFVEPAPVPVTFQISEVANEADDQTYIVLTVFSPTGQSTYFLEPALALALGEVITKKAAEYTESSANVQ